MDRSTFLTELHGRFGLPGSAVQALARRATGRHVARAVRLIRGDEWEVHRVELVDGDAVFVRVCFPDAPRRKAGLEADAMRRARALGVPAPDVLLVETVPTAEGERQVMVVKAAVGVQLSQIQAALSSSQRSAVMCHLGELLGLLSTVRLPGYGRPDQHGRWLEPEEHRRRYFANARRACESLDEAGLSGPEVEQIRNLLSEMAIKPIIVPPILCHGDISPEHIFVDHDQHVTGLIDWGLWFGGSPADELAALSVRLSEADFSAALSRHPAAMRADPGLRRAVSGSVLTQGIGELAWLIRSRQSHGRSRLVLALRQAIDELARPA